MSGKDLTEGHTAGPWDAGHFGSDMSCQCRSICSEGYMGAIATVHFDNGLMVGDGGNDSPPRDEAIANMHLIAAAPQMKARIAELEEALRKVIAWEGAIEIAAPDLGGCLKALWAARAVLERND